MKCVCNHAADCTFEDCERRTPHDQNQHCAQKVCCVSRGREVWCQPDALPVIEAAAVSEWDDCG